MINFLSYSLAPNSKRLYVLKTQVVCVTSIYEPELIYSQPYFRFMVVSTPQDYITISGPKDWIELEHSRFKNELGIGD